jgi:hypothetical protein
MHEAMMTVAETAKSRSLNLACATYIVPAPGVEASSPNPLRIAYRVLSGLGGGFSEERLTGSKSASRIASTKDGPPQMMAVNTAFSRGGIYEI